VYDGDTPAFRASLAHAESFLVDLVLRARREGRDRMPGAEETDPARVALLGFSQGAYLAGVTAVRHPDLFRAAVLVGGRLKVEALVDRLPAARGLPVLGLHGREDVAVRPGPSRESLERAAAAGLAAEFREMDGGHEFTPEMRRVAREWLGARFPAAS